MPSLAAQPEAVSLRMDGDIYHQHPRNRHAAGTPLPVKNLIAPSPLPSSASWRPISLCGIPGRKWFTCSSVQCLCTWVFVALLAAWIVTVAYLLGQRHPSVRLEGTVAPHREDAKLEDLFHVPIRLAAASSDQLRVSTHATLMQKDMGDIVLSAVVYGPWQVRHPRFIRTSHTIWWHAVAATRLPFGGSCAQEYHPGIHTIPAADMHHVLGGDLRAAETISRILNFDEDPIPSHEGWLVVCMADNGMTDGQSAILYNATIAVPEQHECAQGARFDALRFAGAISARTTPVEKQAALFYAAIPGAASSLHSWMHHVLPKIAQASLMNERTESWTPLHSATDVIPLVIAQLYEHIGWNAPVTSNGQPFAADALMYACRSPPLHPLLWQHAQKRVLGIPYTPAADRHNIVFCMDVGSGATQLADEHHLLSFLTKWSRSSDSRFKVFDYRTLHFDNLEAELAFWAQTRALIGAHSNCLAHAMFIPSNALVVELFPVASRDHVSAEKSINYLLATSLEHEYWMVPSHIDEVSGLFDVDLVALCDLMVSSLGMPVGERLSLCFGTLNFQEDYKDFMG
jgi:hypothetical protein